MTIAFTKQAAVKRASVTNRVIQGCSRGYTLLELMIAMALGLILMGGAIQILISNQKTFSMTDSIGNTEEGGRFSMAFLTEDIRMTGYSSYAQGHRPPPFHIYDAAEVAAGNEAYCTSPTAAWCTKEGGGTVSDQIAVIKEADEFKSEDCNGNAMVSAAAQSSFLANVYWVQPDDDNEGLSSLYCRGYDITAGVWLGEDALPMIGGVESFQILYGEVNSEGEMRYVSLDRVEKMTNVIAAKIGVLVVEEGAGSLATKERSYSVLDARPFTYEDKRNRTLYSTTVFISNTKLTGTGQGLSY